MTDEATFYRRADQWLDRLLERSPVSATFLGDHRFDDRLGDNSAQALESEHREQLEALAEFEAMDTSAFRLDVRIDHTLILQLIRDDIRHYERIESHRRNPGRYLDEVMDGVFLLLMREFAPLPERLRLALGRLRETPRVLQEGRQNIIPEQVPKVWAETALEQAQQAPGLYTGLLPAIAAEAAPELQADLAQAGQAAAQAVGAYADFLQKDVIPQAAGDFAVGRDLFDELLRDLHMVDYSADQLLETGWQQFCQTKAQMETVAREIDPARSVQDLLEEAKADHPAAAELLDAYQREMASIRQYVLDNDIVTIPEGESLRMIETPGYLRPVIPFAAYLSPGILEEEQEGLFLVTPVDPEAPPEAREQTLRDHYRAKLPIVALHEAYPGHHLQLVWANRQESTPRRLGSILAHMFIEGWAFYCEELLEHMGYIASPVQRLGRLAGQLWRAARIILDVSLQTRGMSVEEAVQILVKECQMEPAGALAEVRWYTQRPTYPQSYLMGKLATLDLVADYRHTNPEVSLREIHDAILGCGSLPLRLMRQQLGLD
jgi:uncharacterized protein (DUF885 family)